MRAAWVLALGVLVAVASMEASGAPPVMGGLDLDTIFNNRRLVESYVKCYLDKGPCAPAFKKVKRHLSEVIATNCAKCSPEQKRTVKKAMSKLSEIRPQGFAQIMAKYDPTRKHAESFKKWLRSPQF